MARFITAEARNALVRSVRERPAKGNSPESWAVVLDDGEYLTETFASKEDLPEAPAKGARVNATLFIGASARNELWARLTGWELSE